jgi:hypothetical protein
MEVPSGAAVVRKPPLAFGAIPKAVTAPVVTAGHAIVVLVEFSIRHGEVEPTTVVVPGVIDVALADRVCHVAAVPLVAVNTCPIVGAVAALTETVVVAEVNPFDVVAIPAVNPEAVPVIFVPTNDDGVPSALEPPVSVTTPDSAKPDELVKTPVVPPVSVAAPEVDPSKIREPPTLDAVPSVKAPAVMLAEVAGAHAPDVPYNTTLVEAPPLGVHPVPPPDISSVAFGVVPPTVPPVTVICEVPVTV